LTGFIEARQRMQPGFGADAADLLTMDGAVSDDVTASITNDAAKLPAGSAVVVDDFHYAAPGAIGRGEPMTASIVAGVLQEARIGGFLNTVVTTNLQVTSYLVEHATQLRPDLFTEQLIAAALAMRAAQPEGSRTRRGLAEPLTAAELRILKLLPTSTYLQMADTLYISRNTVKVHLRSVYQKLGVTSRSQAIERAVDLRLL
jgi:ATP/maltotriose-dependent transcriptional regulator MalT